MRSAVSHAIRPGGVATISSCYFCLSYCRRIIEGARDGFIGNRGAVHAANGTLDGCRHPAIQRIHVEGVFLAANANYFDGYHGNGFTGFVAADVRRRKDRGNALRLVTSAATVFFRAVHHKNDFCSLSSWSSDHSVARHATSSPELL